MSGERDILVLRLQRERVRVQPVNQRLIEAKADVRHLRSVDVSVDEAGKQELRVCEANNLEVRLVRVLPVVIFRSSPDRNDLRRKKFVTQP